MAAFLPKKVSAKTLHFQVEVARKEGTMEPIPLPIPQLHVAHVLGPGSYLVNKFLSVPGLRESTASIFKLLPSD